MGQLVTIEDLKAIATPPATSTYQPVGHHDLAKSIKTISQDVLRLSLANERYEVARDGNQLFSVLTFKGDHSDMGLSVGYRNSLDKSMSIGLCIGAQVYVCSNMMFSASGGGIVVMRKHSKNILTSLEDLTITTLYKAQYTFASLIRDAEKMSTKRIGTDEAFRLMGYLYGHGLLTPRQLPIVHDCWMRPPHAAFNGGNVWQFYNAVTEAYKSNAPSNVLERHIGLHSEMVDYCSYSDIIDITPGAIS
jgi:hypothetical protein